MEIIGEEILFIINVADDFFMEDGLWK